MEGRHVQIMPTLTSIVDQYTMFHWSQVGLVELAHETSELRRRMETMVTLSRC